MTLEQFEAILATLPDTIAVTKYVADKTRFPRLVWNEVAFNPQYASNEASSLTATVAVELITKTEDTSALWTVLRHFFRHRVAFSAICGYDEQNEWFTCEVNVELDVTPENMPWDLKD